MKKMITLLANVLILGLLLRELTALKRAVCPTWSSFHHPAKKKPFSTHCSTVTTSSYLEAVPSKSSLKEDLVMTKPFSV
jgi:hypothetical protein